MRALAVDGPIQAAGGPAVTGTTTVRAGDIQLGPTGSEFLSLPLHRAVSRHILVILTYTTRPQHNTTTHHNLTSSPTQHTTINSTTSTIIFYNLYNLFSECKLCITNSKQKRTKEIENKRKRQAISATLQQKSKRNTKFLIVTCRTRTCAGGAHCISSATP